MTPSERERRIEAVIKCFGPPDVIRLCRQEELASERQRFAECVLDRLDKAVPMVSEEIVKEAFRGGYERGVTSGSLAPKDFSDLDHHWRAWCHEAGHPSFLGEKETGT